MMTITIKSLYFGILPAVLFSVNKLQISDSTIQNHPNALDSAKIELVNQNYDNAGRIISNYLCSSPLDMEGLYLSFAVEQTRILDYESYTIENSRFQSMADSIRDVFEKRLPHLKGRDSTYCLFYLANIYGGVGIIQAKRGNWFEAIKYAVNSFSMLKIVKNREPKFLAANLGLGIFDYYVSSSLKWIPFNEKKENEGLALLESATKADFPYNYAAKNSLCWILIDRQEFGRADSIAQSVLNEYPDNTIFIRIKAFIKFWSGRYKDAITIANKLIAITEQRQPVNWSDLAAGYMILVESYDKIGEKREVCRAARNLFDRSIPSEYLQIPHVKKNIKIINNIYKKYDKAGCQ